MSAQHQFHVLVKYDNLDFEWGHRELADRIEKWIHSGHSEITKVTVTRVVKRAAKRPPARKD